jgi:addiction module HigA family antidote
MGLTQVALAAAMGVPRKHVNELCDGRRTVTAATALILARVFGNTADFWLNVQRRSDLWNVINTPRQWERISRTHRPAAHQSHPVQRPSGHVAKPHFRPHPPDLRRGCPARERRAHHRPGTHPGDANFEKSTSENRRSQPFPKSQTNFLLPSSQLPTTKPDPPESLSLHSFRIPLCYSQGMMTSTPAPHHDAYRDAIRPQGVLEEFACQRLATARWYERATALAARCETKVRSHRAVTQRVQVPLQEFSVCLDS